MHFRKGGHRTDGYTHGGFTGKGIARSMTDLLRSCLAGYCSCGKFKTLFIEASLLDSAKCICMLTKGFVNVSIKLGLCYSLSQS